MKNSWIIALREWKERVTSRSFIFMSILGPIVILALVYVLFALGGQSKQHWNVLIVDPGGIMENKIMAHEDKAITYDFADSYIEIEEFAKTSRLQKYDALLEVNEKVLSNKTAFAFYREKPSVNMQIRMQFHFERRLEEVMVKEFTKLSVSEFRKIKQPIMLNFRNVYDPKDEASDLRAWVGFFFGLIIFVFIFLFGMTILRSISKEKSNRIVEVLLGSVSPKQLMLGKIIGIGLSAIIQFAIWVLFIAIGLYYMRETIFPDLYDASMMDITQMTKEVQNQTFQEQFFVAREYNQFVDLVYERINFGTMIGYFVLFFIVGYFFYGTLFAAIGATTGSESDGQQFIIPISALLLFALYGGYYLVHFPNGPLAAFFHYLPFTSPVAVMVKLSIGYEPGTAYQLFLSLLILVISSFACLQLAGRLYANGILQFGHRVRLRHVFQWIKKTHE